MFRRYKPFFRAGAMDLMAYKFNIFTWLIVSILEVAVVIFLWISVYKNSENGVDSVINGFTFKEMITYAVMINIFTFVTVDSTTLWTINEEIKQGTISMSFVKPISYRKRFIATTLGNVTTMNLLFGLPCFTIAYLVFYLIDFIVIESIGVFILHLLLFIIAQFVAVLIFDSINYIFGVLCFYTSSGWGVNQIKEVITSFLSGALLPIAFFPPIFSLVVSYLPFAGLASNPIMILLMKVNVVEAFKLLGISIVWVVILEVIAWLLFKHASKKITVHGG